LQWTGAGVLPEQLRAVRICPAMAPAKHGYLDPPNGPVDKKH